MIVFSVVRNVARPLAEIVSDDHRERRGHCSVAMKKQEDETAKQYSNCDYVFCFQIHRSTIFQHLQLQSGSLELRSCRPH